jgi:hypothetical protein
MVFANLHKQIRDQLKVITRLLFLIIFFLGILVGKAYGATPEYVIHIAAETQYENCNGGYPVFDKYGKSPALEAPVVVTFVNDDPRPECVVSLRVGSKTLNVAGGSSESAALGEPGDYGYGSAPHPGYGGPDSAGILRVVAPAPPSPSASPVEQPSESPVQPTEPPNPAPTPQETQAPLRSAPTVAPDPAQTQEAVVAATTTPSESPSGDAVGVVESVPASQKSNDSGSSTALFLVTLAAAALLGGTLTFIRRKRVRS